MEELQWIAIIITIMAIPTGKEEVNPALA